MVNKDSLNLPRLGWWVLGVLLIFLQPSIGKGGATPAQNAKNQATGHSAEAVRVDRAPKLDGTLDDEVWQSVKPITDFRQREPQEGEPATEKTEVRILYTRHAVYFGIHCFDSEPSRIIATELRRDVSQDLDDHFEILINSNHDRRRGYIFEINPLETQSDGLVGRQSQRALLRPQTRQRNALDQNALDLRLPHQSALHVENQFAAAR
jgi:hypothetical protein